VISALTRQVHLVALVQPLGVALEQRRRGRHRHLHERLGCASAHHGHQPVHPRFVLVLETVENLHALDELGVLLQSQHRRRSPGQPPLPHQPAVGICRAQPGLDHPLQSHRARHRQPCRPARVMHLQRHRWLTKQQPPPPAAQQALVQRLEHPHHRLHARFVGAIRFHSHPHVAPTASSVPAGDRRESPPREDQHNKESRQKNSTRRPIPDRTRLAFQSARQRVERNVRDVRRRGSSQRRG
jgi:hypothetical protein